MHRERYALTNPKHNMNASNIGNPKMWVEDGFSTIVSTPKI